LAKHSVYHVRSNADIRNRSREQNLPPIVNGAAPYAIVNAPYAGFGRIGVKERTLVIVVNNEEETLKYVQKALEGRQSAPKRIGVVYEKAAITLKIIIKIFLFRHC
jgi:hypothetical protein